MKNLFIWFIIISKLVFSQDKAADEIIKKVKGNFDLINDYVVEIKGIVNFPDAVIPELRARIYYKKPDKVKIESEQFMILPKQSIRFMPEILENKNLSSLMIGQTDIGNIKHFIIKIISTDPEVDESVTLWINSENYTITKANFNSPRIGKVEVEFFHSLIDGKYWLPMKVYSTFDATKIRLPKMKLKEKENKENGNLPRKGEITIYYSDFKVNKGLSDDVFRETKNR